MSERMARLIAEQFEQIKELEKHVEYRNLKIDELEKQLEAYKKIAHYTTMMELQKKNEQLSKLLRNCAKYGVKEAGLTEDQVLAELEQILDNS